MPTVPATSHPRPAHRRVVVGSEAGRSAVVEDARDLPSVELTTGIVLQELWQQPRLPAHQDDLPGPGTTLGPDAPTSGAVVRILTVPGATAGRPHRPHLHTDPSLHVITMIEGELVVVLEDGETLLATGDSIVLRAAMHDLRNDQSAPAVFVYTSFPLPTGAAGSGGD